MLVGELTARGEDKEVGLEQREQTKASGAGEGRTL